MQIIRARALLALSTLALVAAGCGSDTPAPTTDQAQLRVIHASSDAPAVDVYAKGNTTPLFTNVKYGDTTAFKSVNAGTVQVELRATGSAASSTPAYTSPTLTLTKDQKIDAIAAGLLASTDPASSFRIVPLVEGFTAPAAGKIKVRIVHAGADAPTVGLDVGNDGSVEVPSLARFADTGAAGVELPAATDLQVGVVAGSPAAPVTAFTVPALPAGTQAIVIATGLLAKEPRESNGFALLAAGVGFVKQNPRVYTLHLSPDAPAVDVFLGTTELIDNLSFGQLKGIQAPPTAAGYTLDIFGHTAGSTRPPGNPVASPSTGKLDAGEKYLLIADGFLTPPSGNGNAFTVLKFQEGFDLTDAANARVRLVHGAPDVPAVDIGVVAGGSVTQPPVASNVPYKAESGIAGLSLPAATLPVGIAVAGSPTPVVTFSVTTAAGLRAFAIAGGSLNNVGGNGVKLYIVNTGASPWTVAAIAPNT